MREQEVNPDSEAVQDIFSDTCEFPPEEREVILNDRCGGNVRLRTAVLELLKASDSAGRFMSIPEAAVERVAIDARLAAELPAQIGEFKIIRLLGEGGFGSVYLAAQEHPVRREVALKVIKLGMDTAQVIARFEAERQALAMMDHPNIAKVFDAGATEAGRPYFVMERVNGVPITEYCDAQQLTIRQRLELFIPVCLAVGHAHQKGIIHRDIKPSNVMVAVHDGKPVPKVIDFGVAKATGLGLAEQTGLTSLRPMAGTLEYMSPEQADLSDRDVDTRSDVYSLGALLYELLTGKTPFDGRELREKGYSEAQRILREVEPVRPSARCDGVGKTPDQGERSRVFGVAWAKVLLCPWSFVVRASSPAFSFVVRASRLPSENAGEDARTTTKDEDHGQVNTLAHATPTIRNARSDSATLAKRRASDPRRLGGLLRGDLDWVVMRCLEKDKGRRYQTAAALAEDVQRHLRNEPVSAGPATASYRAKKYIRRHKAAVVVIAALAGGLLVAIAGTTTGMLRARASQQKAEQSAIQAGLEAARANSVSDFMRGVFALAQPESGAAGEEAKIEDVLKRTAAEIEARLRGRPAEQVMASRMLAEACRRLMLHELAAGQLRHAYDLSRSLAGEEHSERTLDLASELVLELYVIGKGESAADLARTTLKDCRASLGESNPVTWKATDACALALSEAGAGEETFALLSQLVERIRNDPKARNANHLARYQSNLAVCLRDRGDDAGATAAIRAAAEILKINRLDPAMSGFTKEPGGPTLTTDELSSWIHGIVESDTDLAYSNAWVCKQIVESGGFPEAAEFLERYVAAAMILHPGGTPTLSDRVDDLALVKLRSGDIAGSSKAFERAIELRRTLRGRNGMMEQERWRIWTLSNVWAFREKWVSTTLRDHLWCALDDLLRDNPPERLIPQEMPVEKLRYRLFRWSLQVGSETQELVSEGGLDELRAMEEPPQGLYLLGLEVPRLGDAPLRRACWLLVLPWAVETRPIPRFDVARSMPSATNLERLIATSGPVTQKKSNALAMHDGLDLMTSNPSRLNWFTVRATTRVNLSQGFYRFSASADDGVRVWVDGQLTIDAWNPQSSTTRDNVVELEAGEHDLKVEYFQQVGGYSLWLQVTPMSIAAKAFMFPLGGGVPQLDSQISRLNQEISDFPGDRALRALHARAMARRGRFAKAATEFAEVTRLDPMSHQHARLRATLLANQGDWVEYRTVCREMFERFSTAKDEATRENLIRACCLGEELPVEAASFAMLIDQLESKGKKRLVLAMAHYRLGRFDAAVNELDNVAFSNEQPTIQATARMFRAMSLRRLGRNSEATGEFNTARRMVEEAIPVADVEDLDSVGLENWLACQIVWKEIAKLFVR